MRGLVELQYQRNTFSGTVEDVLGEMPEGSRVLLDLSSCSSYVFYPLIKKLFCHNISLYLAYAEAEIYYPAKDEWAEVAGRADQEDTLFVRSFEEADFQSMGVDDVYPYSLFAEMNPGNRPSALVAVPNFNVARMNSIIYRDRELNKTESRGIVWVVGSPPSADNEWRIDAVKRTNSIENVGGSDIFYASTLYYKEMLQTLECLWQARRYTHQLSVGCLGSKMQHVGNFIFLWLHQEVGIWIAEPSAFQAGRFSKGSGRMWLLDFDSTAKVRGAMGKYMSFECS